MLPLFYEVVYLRLIQLQDYLIFTKSNGIDFGELQTRKLVLINHLANPQFYFETY